jgi:hypothetical protein
MSDTGTIITKGTAKDKSLRLQASKKRDLKPGDP